MTADTTPRMIRVTRSRSRAFREAYAIYESTIPKSEQKTRAQIVASLARPDVWFWAFERAKEIIGVAILYGSRTQNVLLLEYLAVSPSAQGQGIGSLLFSAAFEASRFDSETLLLIEVDSEAEDVSAEERAIRLKRKQFYRRLGCLEVAGFNYILPLENYGPAPQMSLLVLGASGGAIETARLRRAVEDVYAEVYACSRADPRIPSMFAGHDSALQLT